MTPFVAFESQVRPRNTIIFDNQQQPKKEKHSNRVSIVK
jgi:hypothetical protein